ncbi:MAG: alpha/beta fold hydrolase [Clostridia bacterium]|nr:alpha/beta fold hydrolase [Clostridia bacterium]
MPLIDIPLEELKNYQGSSPCPDDFDEFWDRSLAEMNAIDPQPIYTPNPIKSRFADCYDLYFKSTKGATIYAKFARPKNADGKLPAILHFHGLGGTGESWRTIIAYVSQGYCVVSIDVRGQGGRSEDVGGQCGTTCSTPFIRGVDGPPENLLYRDIYLDTAMLYRVVTMREDVDPARVGVFGASQGGGLALACAALVPEIKLCSSVYPYLSDYKRVWDMDLDTGAYDGIRYYFRLRDQQHKREDEFFYKLGYIDVQNLAHRIRAKVHMTTGLMDTTCPPSTQFAAYNKITSEKEIVIYHDFGHEVLYENEDIEFNFLADL